MSHNAPIFILCRPQLGENIGAAARVMGNFALPDLRLVAPRDGWPNQAAQTMAAGSPVLDHVQVFSTLKDATADCNLLLSTTATPRDMVKPVVTARQAIKDKIQPAIKSGQRVGVLFGCEKSGHSNEEIMITNAIISLTNNSEFSSLNLAMACGIVAYEWHALSCFKPSSKSAPIRATQKDLEGLYAHLHTELSKARFFYPEEKTAIVMRNIINIFARADLSVQETQTLRGIIKALALGRGRKN